MFAGLSAGAAADRLNQPRSDRRPNPGHPPDSNHALAWQNRGNVYLKLEQNTEAIADYSNHRLAQPPSSLMHCWVGRSLLSGWQYERREQIIRRSETGPNYQGVGLAARC